MNYNKFRKYYSPSRVLKYYKATGKNKQKTIILYYGNMRIAQAFHPLLGIMEVILRNRLHCELSKYFNDNKWIINQKNGFMISPLLTYTNKQSKKQRTNDYILREVTSAEKKLTDKGANVTPGRIIAEQTLGFWNSFFEPIHYKILQGIPAKIFTKLPTGYGRKEINASIIKIREFRNRINHNEPICFNSNNMNFSYVRDMHKTIIDFLSWIDPDIIISIYEIDKVIKTIDKEETKQLTS